MNKKIDSYLKNSVNMDKSGKTKFWITGHSRGAAVANLYAKRMNKKIGKENVFAYTFATPKVAIVESSVSKVIESNIYNYCNRWDYITMVPPYYGRYGKDIKIHLDESKEELFKSKTGIKYKPKSIEHSHSQTAYLVWLSYSNKVKATNTKIIKKDGYWKENGKVTKVECAGNRFTYYAPLSCGKMGYYDGPSKGYKKGKKTFEIDKNCECSIEIFRDTPPTKKMKTEEFVKKFKKYANLDGGLFLFEVKNGKIIRMTVNVYG